ncbi:putative mannosyltransferase KTR3 [Smittium mucronatum]|uniref:Putative mannosyltransferase KTR3 n=1 Tax=Smittium mucronatum TaxID=133383 RepID=A0A1R0GMI0_9FUNG|nr:putative mannosyltransferase KTR3 [Smittium mucronatum]
MTKSPVYFGVIPGNMWQVPSFIDTTRFETNLKENADSFVHGGSRSYRIMSRFFAKFVQSHPLLRNLDYFWRLTSGADYLCDIDYDPFEYMKANNKKYGWVISPQEYKLTIPTLWGTVLDYIKNNTSMLPSTSFASFLVDSGGNYNTCHFWSNFEIVSLDFMRTSEYQSLVDAIDLAGGMFYERWGDAPIRSIAASLFLEKKEFHWFEDLGYSYTGNVHCPSNATMFKKCTGCTIGSSVVYSSKCYKKYKGLVDIPKTRLLELIKS